MREVINRGLRNALVQRVKRHTHLTTLFRAPVSTSVPDIPPSTTEKHHAQFAEPIEGVVQASLLPPTASLPQGFLVGQNPLAGLSQSKIELPETDSSPPPIHTITHREHAARSELKPALQKKEEPGIDQGQWPRLQAIYRKHQEKSDQASPAVESISVNPDLAEATDLGTLDISEKMDESEVVAAPGVSLPTKLPEKPAYHGVQTKPVEAVNKLSDSSIKSWQGKVEPLEVSVGPDSQPQRGTVQASSATGETITENFSPREAQPAVEHSHRREIVERSEDLPAKGTEIQANNQAIQASLYPDDTFSVGQDEHAIPGDQVTPPVMPLDSAEGTLVEKEQSIQSLPLQAAWPIQRLQAGQNTTEFKEAESPDDLLITESSPASLGVEPSANPENYSPRESNRAEIEFIPPRRSPPLQRLEESRHRSKSIQLGTDSTSEKSIDRGGGKSRGADERVQPSEPQIDVEKREFIRKPNTLVPSNYSQKIVQAKKASGPKDMVNSDKQEFIQTAMRPLPSDLWTLVGHLPPDNEPDKPEVPGGPVPEKSVDIVGREVFMDGATGLSPSFSSSVDNQVSSRIAPTLVQREAIPDQGQNKAEIPASAVAPQNPLSEPISQNSVQDLKIDDLARQVYVEIYRRLVVEKERLPR